MNQEELREEIKKVWGSYSPQGLAYKELLKKYNERERRSREDPALVGNSPSQSGPPILDSRNIVHMTLT